MHSHQHYEAALFHAQRAQDLIGNARADRQAQHARQAEIETGLATLTLEYERIAAKDPRTVDDNAPVRLYQTAQAALAAAARHDQEVAAA